jgi:hypothetical protein
MRTEGVVGSGCVSHGPRNILTSQSPSRGNVLHGDFSIRAQLSALKFSLGSLEHFLDCVCGNLCGISVVRPAIR